MSQRRYALTYAPADTVERYLPGNYRISFAREYEGRTAVVIEGVDNSGWTLDAYVIPRLASGLHFATEIDLSHPIMHSNPASPDGIL